MTFLQHRRLTNLELEQLKQLLTVTWDGQLINKMARDDLIPLGLVERRNGYNFLTRDGIDVTRCRSFETVSGGPLNNDHQRTQDGG